MELPEEVNIILKESHNISLLKLLDSLPIMLDVQHIIDLEQHVKLPNPLPLTHDEEDENISNLLGYVQTISTKASNSVCSTLDPRSYSVHNYKPKKPIDLLSMSFHSKMFDSTELFACIVYILHVDIIKQIQASNEQYKFRADSHKYHDVLNVGDYFMIQIRLEQCSLKTSHKL